MGRAKPMRCPHTEKSWQSWNKIWAAAADNEGWSWPYVPLGKQITNYLPGLC